MSIRKLLDKPSEPLIELGDLVRSSGRDRERISLIAETDQNRKLRRRYPLRRICPTVDEAHALLREYLDGIALILRIGPPEVRRNSTVHRHGTMAVEDVRRARDVDSDGHRMRPDELREIRIRGPAPRG